MNKVRSPGWDKQIINEVATRDYGGLPQMFAAHGWSIGVQSISQVAPTRVVETYGNVAAFAAAHPADLPDPLGVIEEAEPDVWLTSYHGFSPDSWGLLGFTHDWMRRNFLAKSRPGALVVIYGTGGCKDPRQRGRVLGIQQQTHIRGHKRDFIPPERWDDEQSDPYRARKWNFAIRAHRAWRITQETCPKVLEFAPTTFPGRAQFIGAQGVRLPSAEAKNLLGLDLEEVEVFGGRAIDEVVAGPAATILRPSKAGPVSSTGYWTKEAEGPKHLYVLKLEGNGHHFMGEDIGDQSVIKVGMSRSPTTRCEDHNRALPTCAFRWSVALSTFTEGRKPFSTSRPALVGEQAMKNFLAREGRSLGGEFFLAQPHQIAKAWQIGLAAAGENE